MHEAGLVDRESAACGWVYRARAEAPASLGAPIGSSVAATAP